MTENNTIVIKTEDVVKEYSDNGVPVKAVRGIDLEIKKGEFTAIVGPSGSGKTTFLNIISGLDDVMDCGNHTEILEVEEAPALRRKNDRRLAVVTVDF